MICDFPDLYDYGFESYGVGDYCLMGFGASEHNPAQVCAYLKNQAGWTSSLTVVKPGMTASVTAGRNDFLRYARSPTEYFLAEEPGTDRSRRSLARLRPGDLARRRDCDEQCRGDDCR